MWKQLDQEMRELRTPVLALLVYPTNGYWYCAIRTVGGSTIADKRASNMVDAQQGALMAAQDLLEESSRLVKNSMGAMRMGAENA